MLKKLSYYINSPSQNSRSFAKDKTHLHDSFDFLALIRAWKDIAGAKLSEHTIPLKNQNGVLIILSNHSAFANELSYMELPLKRKIVEKFPNLEKSISSIKFIVDSTHFSEQYAQFIEPMEKTKSMALHPFSPEFRKLKKDAEELFSDVEDPEIKERMISIYMQSNRK